MTTRRRIGIGRPVRRRGRVRPVGRQLERESVPDRGERRRAGRRFGSRRRARRRRRCGRRRQERRGGEIGGARCCRAAGPGEQQARRGQRGNVSTSHDDLLLRSSPPRGRSGPRPRGPAEVTGISCSSTRRTRPRSDPGTGRGVRSRSCPRTPRRGRRRQRCQTGSSR